MRTTYRPHTGHTQVEFQNTGICLLMVSGLSSHVENVLIEGSSRLEGRTLTYDHIYWDPSMPLSLLYMLYRKVRPTVETNIAKHTACGARPHFGRWSATCQARPSKRVLKRTQDLNVVCLSRYLLMMSFLQLPAAGYCSVSQSTDRFVHCDL